MLSEYGTPNHKWMKEIYEKIMNEQLIKQNGIKINNRGDKVAMVYTYQVLYHFFIYKIRKSKMKHDEAAEILYPIKTQSSQCWDGIGEWRH